MSDQPLYRDPLDPRAQRLARWATYASVSVAAVLVAVKAGAWFVTGSVAMLSSLMDSALDLFASLVTFVAVRVSLRPPDAEHRFGHGKAQPLAALAQSAFIAGSGVFLLIQAGERLIRPEPVRETDLGIAVIALSVVLTLGLVSWQRHVARRTGSVAVAADMAHYGADLLANGAVILGLALAGYAGLSWADPVVGGAIALFLMHGAWGIARGALDLLMDREMDEAERARIVEIATSYTQVVGVNALRTRRTGTHAFIEIHLAMSGSLTLTRAHAIGQAVAFQIQQVFPDADVIVHHDPAAQAQDG